MKLQDVKFSQRDKKRKKYELQEKSGFRHFVDHPKKKYKRSSKPPLRSMHDWIAEYSEED